MIPAAMSLGDVPRFPSFHPVSMRDKAWTDSLFS
jgi:hypothetical protein